MKLIKKLPIFFGLLVSSFIVNAADIKQLCTTEFQDLLAEGLRTHPSITVSKKLVLGSELQVDIARWGYFPTPSVNISGSSSNASTTLRLDQPLWAGGKIDASRDKAKALNDEANFSYALSQFNLIEDYLNALQKYLQAQNKIDILNVSVTELKSMMETVDRMIIAGELSVADKNLLNTIISDVYSSLEITQAEFDVAKIQLEILTGYKVRCNIASAEKEIFPDKINLELLVNETLNSHPELKILTAQIEAAKADVDSAESKLWPTLKLRGEHTKGSLYKSNDSNKEDSLIYLMLEMSTGAGASALNNIERSKINVLKVKSQKLSKEKVIVDQLMNNYTRFVAVKTNIELLLNDIKIAEKVYESNKRLFFLQQKKWLDVVNALSKLNIKKISKAQLISEFKALEMKLALKTNRLSLVTGGVLSDLL
jgi:adhesin transport system outer membrane protein|tara:strand:+ start:1062 stop:2339 length:1278 start_codon:yes stop_codon:yes gene_type:complete